MARTYKIKMGRTVDVEVAIPPKESSLPNTEVIALMIKDMARVTKHLKGLLKQELKKEEKE